MEGKDRENCGYPGITCDECQTIKDADVDWCFKGLPEGIDPKVSILCINKRET